LRNVLGATFTVFRAADRLRAKLTDIDSGSGSASTAFSFPLPLMFSPEWPLVNTSVEFSLASGFAGNFTGDWRGLGAETDTDEPPLEKGMDGPAIPSKPPA
jgi:hypothetical protein